MADAYLCFRLSNGAPIGLLPEAPEKEREEGNAVEYITDAYGVKTLGRPKGGSVKTYRVKKLADGEHKGKFGVFDAADGDAMMGLAEIEGFSERYFNDSYGAGTLGPKGRAYKEALKRHTENLKCSERDAEVNFVCTDEGVRLYEAFRSERMGER